MTERFEDHPAELVACLSGHVVGEGVKQIRISPAGEVQSRKGSYVMDETAARLIIEGFEAHGVEVPVDYQHSTLDPGSRAPAAGWIKRLYFDQTHGLMALVRWTEEARESIRKGEFGYLSPVLMIRKEDRRAVELHSCGITTKPAIPRMERLAASAGHLKTERTAMVNNEKTETETTAMDLVRQIAEALGLKPGAKTSEVLKAALERLSSTPEEEEGEATEVAATVRAKLGLPEDAGKNEVLVALSLLEHSSATQVTQTEREREAEEQVQNLIATGRLNPHDEPAVESARHLALTAPDRLKALFVGAPSRMPPQGRTTPPNPQTMQRRSVIQKALSVYLSRDDLQRQTSDSAYINLSLREVNLPKLEEGELVKYL